MSDRVTESRYGLTRRQAFALGVGGTVGLMAGFKAVVAAVQNRTAQPPPSFPTGAIIRTLSGDIAPDRLATGPVLFHEHLSETWPLPPPGQPPQATFFDDVAGMIEEVKAAKVDGHVSCIVDGSHPDMFRKLENLRQIARESGVYVVASGGYYMQRTYPADIATKSPSQIADDLVAAAKLEGLGAFGEIGQSAELTTDERKVFQAVGQAHMRTGLPIFTHNPYTGTRQTATPPPRDAALRQLDILESAGASPQHIAIGHVCCLDEPKAEVAIELARRGAFVGFDRVTIPTVPDSLRVTMILAMLNAGCADNLLLSSDFYSPTMLKKNGGGGLAQTVTVFAPMLTKAGVKDEVLRRILVDNPRRFLSFVPKN
jgi:phosphotriesterase-related protein